MKFTCDNCGAQYLIADDKLGQRGVKVRCKKCSYVIILRPKGYEEQARAADAREPAHAIAGARTDVSPAVVPAVSGYGAVRAQGALPSEVLAATSSDLGLSQEFAAMGFEEDEATHQHVKRGMSLSVGLDLGGMQERLSDSVSPFAVERGGGSLDVVASERPAARPGHPMDPDATEVLGRAEDPDDEDTPDPNGFEAGNGVERTDRGAALGGTVPVMREDSQERTRVDELRFDEESDGDAPLVSPVRDAMSSGQSRWGAAGESGFVPRDRGDDEEEDDAGTGDLTPESSPRPTWSDEVTRDEDSDRLTPRARDESVPPTPERRALGDWDEESGDVSQALAGMQRNELAEMKSSVGAELEGLSNDFDWGGDGAAERSNDHDDAGEDASDDSDDDQALDSDTDDALDAEGEGTDSSDADGQEEIAAEIGDAFDAMFSPARFAASEDEQANLVADTENADPEQLEALRAMARDPDPSRLETRVFDTGAIAQVQAEQDRASTPAPVNADEWYVAIDDEQVGPLSFPELEDRWNAGELTSSTLCWKQGMAAWTAAGQVPELQSLGPQEDLESTVAAQESSEEESAEALAPKIAPAPTAVTAPVPEHTEEKDPSWRPSAASALASLAAAELADAPATAPKAEAALSASLPTSSLALEKLLEGSPSGPAATMFGAAEKSESYVRPLPRRTDTVSSMPLRDPVARRTRPTWAVPASIIGGFVLLAAVGVAAVLMLNRDSKAAPAAGSAPVAAVTPPPAAPPAAAVEPAVPPPAAEAAPVEEKVEELAAVVAQEPPAKRVEPTKARTERTASADTPRKARRRRAREVEASPPPPPPPPPPVEASRPVSEEDELLGGGRPRRRVTAAPSSDLPEKLDESDIFSVMRQNRNDVRDCLSKQAAADPALEGAMTVKMVLRRDGRPTRIAVGPDKFRGSVVGKCIMASVKTWKFPEFSGTPMPIDFPVQVRSQ